MQVPLVHAIVVTPAPVPVQQVNPVQVAATVLAKQLSPVSQHPTTVVVVVVAVYDGVHEVAHEYVLTGVPVAAFVEQADETYFRILIFQ